MVNIPRFFSRRLGLLPLFAAFCVLPVLVSAEPVRLGLTGLNIAGGEFGEGAGHYGRDYIYPGAAELEYAAKKGFSVIRLPFRWERLQPKLNGELNQAELNRLREVVALASARKLSVILNPHNYARYGDKVIGSVDVPASAFADFWRRVADAFKGEPGIVFGLMNEPHDMPTQDWAEAAQAAIDAIRAAGACELVLVPGNGWSGAHSWAKDGYGTPNSIALAGIKDPANNIAFEFHQYLDPDFSGTGKTCRAPTEVLEAINAATQWLNEGKRKGFLGEFGASDDPQCMAGLEAMMSHLESHANVWLGWTYWASGAWWPKDYALSVQPLDGKDRPQMALLEKHVGKAVIPSGLCKALEKPAIKPAKKPKP